MKIDWKKKLSSRKFWMAIVGFITPLLVAFGVSESTATDFTGNVAVVLGSEGFGISRLVREKCDFITTIPLYGNVNSMNVSCAAAVILTEVARQRHLK